MEEITPKGEFEELMSPLDTLVVMIYKHQLLPQLPKLYEQFREVVLIYENALVDLDNIIKVSVSDCISKLAKPYRKQLKQIYTDDGVIFYIYSQLKHLAVSFLESQGAKVVRSADDV